MSNVATYSKNNAVRLYIISNNHDQSNVILKLSNTASTHNQILNFRIKTDNDTTNVVETNKCAIETEVTSSENENKILEIISYHEQPAEEDELDE